MSDASPKPRLTRFFLIWIGQAFSLLGSQIVQFALIWYLTQRTESASVLAFASLAGFLPPVFIGPIAGTLVDRWSRRVIMIVADITVAAATIALIAMFMVGEPAIWMIYVILLIRATAGAFHRPAMLASTTMLVPEEHLTRIGGLNEMLANGLNIIAAPLAAFALGLLPLQMVLGIDIVTAVLAVLPLLFVAIPQPAREESTEQKSSILNDLQAGMRYLWNWKGMFVLVMIFAFANLVITPAYALLPLIVQSHFEMGAVQLGWLESALGIGAVAGGLLLTAWGGFKKRIVTVMVGMIGFGLGMLAVGFAPANGYVIALIGMAVTGITITIANGALFALFQASVDPDKQGRVFTLMDSIATVLTPVGLASAGPVAGVLGAQVWFVIAGAFSIVSAGFALMLPAVRNIEQKQVVEAAAIASNEVIAIPMTTKITESYPYVSANNPQAAGNFPCFSPTQSGVFRKVEATASVSE